MAESHEKANENKDYGHLFKVADPVKRQQFEKILGKAPGCYNWMETSITDLELGESISISMPVRAEHLNPGLSMQGGIIGAAFDNAFGPLCWTAGQTSQCAMVDMSSSYHRPIFEGDELKIQARVIAKGKRKVHMQAEAFNGENKLVATAVATYMILG
jgi:uncharacterized protein (TIGR00369 family)